MGKVCTSRRLTRVRILNTHARNGIENFQSEMLKCVESVENAMSHRLGGNRVDSRKLTEQCSEPLWPPRVAGFSSGTLLKFALFCLSWGWNSEPACEVLLSLTLDETRALLALPQLIVLEFPGILRDASNFAEIGSENGLAQRISQLKRRTHSRLAGMHVSHNLVLKWLRLTDFRLGVGF